MVDICREVRLLDTNTDNFLNLIDQKPKGLTEKYYVKGLEPLLNSGQKPIKAKNKSIYNTHIKKLVIIILSMVLPILSGLFWYKMYKHITTNIDNLAYLFQFQQLPFQLAKY